MSLVLKIIAFVDSIPCFVASTTKLVHGELVLLVAASAPQDFWMDTRCVQRLINVCGSMIRGNHEAGRHIHLRCS